ncbi:MAG: hypothetical protein A3E07_02325 [Candidatus Wildermuthbacteria bacterium RIFCSPHIGHO2_12_FULL_45_9]|uniref:Uncharacterized protein n=1 Tax=Candidatus Wildermuthbacteria bacterium RIFCSPHIGHO2_02_FULL_45_25 TaxID=1802450 RepID=A0A1G2R0U9_9BACT|nr:MAG: hypothetical protein A2748_03505 [Candidatus Wildermuthbacteria bacterium RIFCSPHIGHO2_01_FULL_45_20]OHA65892.1 MAG: hypothetical protein A3C04_00130 [Candidatus Wildermuthbacteria bacterium RIFCSPHIGHO2_02_FULL_45_25]OHA70859.1 MAG: hypothetical protein A3E07_02325 [Candidatus Wildermuthbacteria bacterium RIFCSPHIGHO2_12_FULL_45_9]
MATQTITHGTRIPASPHKGNWKLLLTLGAFLIAGAVLFAAIQLIDDKDTPAAAPSIGSVQIEPPEMNGRIAPAPPAPAVPIAPSVLQNAQAPAQTDIVAMAMKDLVHVEGPAGQVPLAAIIATTKAFPPTWFKSSGLKNGTFGVPLTPEGLQKLPWNQGISLGSPAYSTVIPFQTPEGNKVKIYIGVGFDRESQTWGVLSKNIVLE